MCSSIFKNATQTDGFRPEELKNLDDSDFEILRSIVNSLRPQFLKRRTTSLPLCSASDDKTFFEKIPIDKPDDVLSAHQDIAAQFPEWLDALKTCCNVLAIAGNGSKTFVCNMFANYVFENTEDHVLQLNPNSPKYTTKKARRLIFDCLDKLTDDSLLYLIIPSADNPITQNLLYNDLLPWRSEEPRLRMVLALDTLLVHAQIQLWGLRNDFLLKDGIHTFLDFRLELIQQWLRNKPILRQLLGESLVASHKSPNQILEEARMLDFGATSPPDGTDTDMSASGADLASLSSDSQSESDSDARDASDDESDAASENEDVSNKEVTNYSRTRPVTAPPSEYGARTMTTRRQAKLAK